jgi:predicted peptidase
MKTFTIIAILAASFLPGLTTISAAEPGTKPDSQMRKHFSATAKQKLECDYLLFLPKGYEAKGTKQWPLILFLHGAGERGSDLNKVKVHGPPKHVTEDPDFPFIVASPQCPDDQIWSRQVLLGLLDELLAKYKVDPARVYLTGLSMGGYGTWDLGLACPERFAAIAPICGGGNLIDTLLTPKAKGNALKTLGLWAFHGGKDPVVPLSESERMIDLLKRSGLKNIKLTIYPEAGHDSWTESYRNPELYKWFLEHSRQVEKK